MPRASIKPTASSLYKHNPKPSTLLSLDFGEFGVTRCIEGQLDESYDSIESNGILRLQPQVFPPYGKLYLNQASFFVPCHQLYEHYDAMRENMLTERGVKVQNPVINSVNINNLFINGGFSYSTYTLSQLLGSVSDPTSSGAQTLADKSDFTDLSWDSDNSVPVYSYYKLTTIGRRYYKLLKSLGFDFVQYRYSNPQSLNDVYQDIASSTFYPNIYPLLAFAKIYVDMFQNGHVYNSSLLTALLDCIRKGDSFVSSGVTLYDVSSIRSELTPYGLGFILDDIAVPHKSNIYTEAYNYMVNPTGVTNDDFVSQGPSYSVPGLVTPYSSDDVARNTVLQGNNGVDVHIPATRLSDFGLRTLKWFADFVYKRNLVGSKSVDRLFANFGIEPEERNFNYVKKLGEISQRINFHPVVSNSDTYFEADGTGKVLGAYAGFAAEGMQMNYNYKLREYGYIIQLAYLTIDPIVIHGFDPQVLRSNPLDFFTPGWDAETVRAIPSCELTHDKNFVVPASNHHTKDVYGFVDSYDDYRTMRDIVAGVFVHEGKDFFFGRDFSNLGGVLKPQTAEVHYYNKVSNKDLTQPFYTDQSQGDRFYLQLDFDIKYTSPVKNKDNAYKVPAGDTLVDEGGNPMI